MKKFIAGLFKVILIKDDTQEREEKAARDWK